jgi:oligopeptide/dipeptide ABC transporter ATP-binding protein
MTAPIPPLLSIRDLRVHYHSADSSKRPLAAVNGVSLDIQAGSIVGLVGESGSGKTTLAKAVAQLTPVSGGRILFHGNELNGLKGTELSRKRKNIQLIFQDPLASLSPRRSILQCLREPLDHFQIGDSRQRQSRAVAALETVDLDPGVLHCYPHELSGGQRQRVALARALVSEPELIIADEAVSSLDVSVQATILDLILRLREKTGIAFLFISHDLAVIQQLADVVAVMYLGKMLEIAPAGALFSQPAHPYTQALLAAVPSPNPELDPPLVPGGEAPSLLTPPAGCVFHTRCPEAMEQCERILPAEENIVEQAATGKTHIVRCHLWNS